MKLQLVFQVKNKGGLYIIVIEILCPPIKDWLKGYTPFCINNNLIIEYYEII